MDFVFICGNCESIADAYYDKTKDVWNVDCPECGSYETEIFDYEVEKGER